MAWEDYTSSNKSIIVKLFGGQQRSSLQCFACNKESVTFEPFFNLSLPIPPSKNNCNIMVTLFSFISLLEYQKSFAVFISCSLYLYFVSFPQDCFELYTKPELISGWSCPFCKHNKGARKRIDIWKLPPVLVVHLQRYAFTPALLAGHTVDAKKKTILRLAGSTMTACGESG